MPWKETDTMSQRDAFIEQLISNRYTMSEACERFGISRPTGYKWWNRFREEGKSGLSDRSRAPYRCPHKTPEAIEKLIVEQRLKHPLYGARKLLDLIRRMEPSVELPAPSTVGAILRRHGLAARRTRRRRSRHPGRRYVDMSAPNDVWSADFKGQFRMGNGRYVFPLTIQDGYSRSLLACKGLYTTAHETAREAFERCFREYGLPLQILTDNGVPFVGPNALAGLSRLAVWWIRLESIRFASSRAVPIKTVATNGCTERSRNTPPGHPVGTSPLNSGVSMSSVGSSTRHGPMRVSMAAVPSEHYSRSPRAYPKAVPKPEYPNHFELRKVASNGCFKWHDRFIIASRTLVGETIGLEEFDQGLWSVYFGPVLLVRFDERERRLYP